MFCLVFFYDILEDKCIDDLIVNNISLFYHETNGFHVAKGLCSVRSQKTPKCGENISDTLSCALCATFLLLPHFDLICYWLPNRHTATWIESAVREFYLKRQVTFSLKNKLSVITLNSCVEVISF